MFSEYKTATSAAGFIMPNKTIWKHTFMENMLHRLGSNSHPEGCGIALGCVRTGARHSDGRLSGLDSEHVLKEVNGPWPRSLFYQKNKIVKENIFIQVTYI
jgi:hypothetical protein